MDSRGTDLVIVGAGGFGREVLSVVTSIAEYSVLGWLDDNPSAAREEIHGLPVLGGLDWVADRENVSVAVAIGDPTARQRVIRRLKSLGHDNFPKLIHPLAQLGAGVRVGEGSIICAGNILTVDIDVGDFAIVNLDCTVGHDARIGSYTTISPGSHISGDVRIGEAANLGTGSVVIQGVTIGREVVIGAGAVVVRDVPDGVTAVGVPAKVISRQTGE